MTRVCSGCGLHTCEGRCYLESPADYPEPTCIGCDQPFDANGFCKRCEEYALTACAPDPLKHLEPKRNAA